MIAAILVALFYVLVAFAQTIWELVCMTWRLARWLLDW